jgi:hypothetical protein
MRALEELAVELHADLATLGERAGADSSRVAEVLQPDVDLVVDTNAADVGACTEHRVPGRVNFVQLLHGDVDCYHAIAMHKLTAPAMLCLLAACTTEDSLLVGEYACTTTQTTAFSEPAGIEPTTLSATQTALVSELGDGRLSVEIASTGGLDSASCALRFTGDETSAQLDAGQSCDVATGSGNFNVVLTFGRLHLSSDDMLLGDFNGNISGRLLINGTATAAIGSMVQSNACSRL